MSIKSYTIPYDMHVRANTNNQAIYDLKKW